MAKIVAHTIVKNESRWIWYILQSALPFVDEIIIGNHGSTDNTIEIIKSIASPKIKILDFSHIPDNKYSEVRTAMMKNTKTDWLLILDGDEIWPKEALRNSLQIISQKPDLDFMIQPFYNLIGDVYHYQSEKAGRYNICGHTGHVTIRFINVKKIGGLKFQGLHMQQGVFDPVGNLVQEIPQANYIHQPVKYFHTTHLRRSSQDNIVQKRSAKYKYELGIPFPKNFSYPESLFLPHPTIVPEPWERVSILYLLLAAIQSPIKYLKRMVIST